MKKITFLLMISLSFFAFNGCDDDDETINYIAFENTSYDFGVELDGSSTNDIKVYTTQVSSSDRTFNINVLSDLSTADPASYNVPTSVTVPANSNVGTFSVNISDINIGENGETLVLGFENKDELYTGENITLKVRQVCPYNEVVLSITFDDWAEETSWELLDSDDNVVASGGAGGAYGGMASFSQAFCLVDGTYTFTIFDAYGDGTNHYQLVYNGETIAEGGAFEYSETTVFEVSM